MIVLMDFPIFEISLSILQSIVAHERSRKVNLDLPTTFESSSSSRNETIYDQPKPETIYDQPKPSHLPLICTQIEHDGPILKREKSIHRLAY